MSLFRELSNAAAAALALSLVLVTGALGDVLQVRGNTLEVGRPLPEVMWDGLPEAAQTYLGLSSPAGSTDRIGGEILLLEFMNTHCQSCMAQAPVMADLHALITGDDTLAGAARVVAVAEGNTPSEVREFAERYGLVFPLIADPRFKSYRAFGNPGGTPYTVLAAKRDGRWIVATTHLGAITTPMLPFYDMKRYRNLDPSLFAGLAKEATAFRVVRTSPVLAMPEGEILDRLRRAPLLRDKDPAVTALDLPHAGRAWKLEVGGDVYFARVFSVAPVCDICHALHFVGVFDRYGEVVELVKLRISRYGNQEISPEEVAFLRSRVRGFSAYRPRLFDPSVDAVSGATMSSSLVFDALADGGVLMHDLIEAGHVTP